jgi:alpha-tubulin suppressor-like RCC1 family protein
LRCALLLIREGALLGDEIGKNDWKTEVQANKQCRRSLKNIKAWTSPYDHDGNSPLDLLSEILSPALLNPCALTEVMSFGKSELLGFPLTIGATEIVKPSRIEDLSDINVVQIFAAKHHSMALTSSGVALSWGLGRSGRLGHGNEDNKLIPTPIKALTKFMIRSISVADNHSLAVTTDGSIFSWGSNSFGQLGLPDKVTLALSPQKLDVFKKVVIVACSAGAHHSMCFTDDYDLYAWGSNKSGQLGLSDDKNLSSGQVRRVTWDQRLLQRNSATRKSVIIQIATGHENTLLLCKSRSKDSVVNELYQWGHGSPSPMRVGFRHKRKNSTGNLEELSFRTEMPISIIQVSAGKFHNVALSDAGHCYTWGRGSDQLGHGVGSTSELSLPLLVTSLLPERGGGKVIHVSACSNRTCAVTERGDVFTWGATTAQGVLGTGSGNSYTPCPRRMLGVKRCVGVACGEDHTITLLSSSRPPLPLEHFFISDNDCVKKEEFADLDESFDIPDEASYDRKLTTDSTIITPPTLKQYCQRKIASQVDTKNAVQILVFAERTYSAELTSYAISFIQRNLDAVLIQSRPNDILLLLEDLYACLDKICPIKVVGKKKERLCSSVQQPRKLSTVSADEESNTVDEIVLRERSKSRDLMTLASALQLQKKLRKKVSGVELIEDALSKGSELNPDQVEKLSRKSALLYELKRLAPILKRLEDEEGIKCKAELRRTPPSVAPTPVKAQALPLESAATEPTTDIISKVNISQLELPAQIIPKASSEPGPSVVTKKKTRFIAVDTFNERKATSSRPPSFNDWGQSVIAIPRTESSNVQPKAAWNVPSASERVVAVFLQVNPTPAVAVMPQFQSPVRARHDSPPDIPQASITLASFFSPPVTSKLKNKSSGGLSCPWTSSSDIKAPKSLSRIQCEEESIRVNSNIALRGHENPWYIERRLRTDSFENIVERQLKESEEESRERAALLAILDTEKKKSNLYGPNARIDNRRGKKGQDAASKNLKKK